MKYKIGDRYFMKRRFKSLKAEEAIEITRVYKLGRRTYVDVNTINNDDADPIRDVPVKMLRKRKHA